MPMTQEQAERFKKRRGHYPSGYTEPEKPTEIQRQKNALLEMKADSGETLTSAESSAIAPYIQERQKIENSNKEQERRNRILDDIYNLRELAPAESLEFADEITNVTKFQDYLKKRSEGKPKADTLKENAETLKLQLQQMILDGKSLNPDQKRQAEYFGLIKEPKPEKGRSVTKAMEEYTGKLSDIKKQMNAVDQSDIPLIDKKSPEYKALTTLNSAYTDSTKLANKFVDYGITDMNEGIALITELENASQQYDKIKSQFSKEMADRYILKDLGMSIEQIRTKLNAFK